MKIIQRKKSRNITYTNSLGKLTKNKLFVIDRMMFIWKIGLMYCL